MTELFANVNGIRIAYEIHGEENNESLILLHGFAVYKEFWFAQIHDLASHFKIITIDSRYAGNSSHPSESSHMDTMVEDIKELMDFLKIEKASIGGHSLGGMVAQNFALKYPERLNKLILLATLPKFAGGGALDMYKKSQIASYEAKLKDPVRAFYENKKAGPEDFWELISARISFPICSEYIKSFIRLLICL